MQIPGVDDYRRIPLENVGKASGCVTVTRAAFAARAAGGAQRAPGKRVVRKKAGTGQFDGPRRAGDFAALAASSADASARPVLRHPGAPGGSAALRRYSRHPPSNGRGVLQEEEEGLLPAAGHGPREERKASLFQAREEARLGRLWRHLCRRRRGGAHQAGRREARHRARHEDAPARGQGVRALLASRYRHRPRPARPMLITAAGIPAIEAHGPFAGCYVMVQPKRVPACRRSPRRR